MGQSISLATLGRRVKEQRGGVGLRKVASDIGVSPATLSRVERGHLPDLENFRKICDWLGVETEDVIGRASSDRPKVAVHFKKDAAIQQETADALSNMILAAQRAWLVKTED